MTPTGNFIGALFTALPKRESVLAYVLAFGLVGIACYVRLKLAPLEAGLQYVAFFPAVTLAAIFCGLGPAIAVTMVCVALATFIFTPPYYTISLEVISDNLWPNIVFLLDGLIVCFSIETLHSYRRKIAKEAQENKARSEALSRARLAELEKIGENVRSFVQQTPVCMSMYDKNMTYLAVSDRWQDVYGDGRSTLVGRNHYECHPDLPEAWKAVHQQALAGSTIKNDEAHWQRADGTQQWLRWAVQPWKNPDGSIGGIIIAAEIITAQKEAEDALRKSEERYRAFTNASSEVRYCMSPDWSEMRQLHGESFLASTEAPNRNWLQDYIHPDDQERVLEVIHHAVRTGTIFELEHRFLRVDGTLGWTFSRALPIYNATGEIVEWFGAASDITDRKKAEADLLDAKAEAEQANLAKSRFLAAASHDLRQPLSALSVYVGSLSNRRLPPEPKTVANMQECIGNLSELLTDLLDLSKLEAGIVAPCVSDFSIAELLASLESVHRPEAEIKGLRLRCHPSLLTGRTDLVLFRRCLGNFIENALRYTERGGVLIACRRRTGKIWIEVWDTGIGIPADKTAEIFEEFRQLGDGARNIGSGLGLAIVDKTAALLGLQISVRSRPGRGSVFAIELPLGQSPLCLLTPTSPTVVEGRPRRIAVVDDNPLVCHALAEGLRALGHEVIATATKAALLAELDQLPPDIVVSDYRLTQGETGFDVIAAVRASLGAELPAILVTGDTDPQLLRSMTDRGIVVLHKPVSLETLQAYVEELT